VPVEIVWSPLARARLAEIHAYVALENEKAAELLATRVIAMVEALRAYPHLGRAGAEPGIRELVVGRTPYAILHRVRVQRIIIYTIWHGAQKR
jgi:toxin ParE1/3/4